MTARPTLLAQTLIGCDAAERDLHAALEALRQINPEADGQIELAKLLVSEIIDDTPVGRTTIGELKIQRN